ELCHQVQFVPRGRINMTKIHAEWAASPARRFRTGVSLHSHTLHSKESLQFIYKAAEKAPVLAHAIARGEKRFLELNSEKLNFARGWWTPPLGPHEAWAVEAAQVERLNLDALVSLTDHDDIEAPVALQLLEDSKGSPISVEWTVPFGPTFFHLGIHNLPGR